MSQIIVGIDPGSRATGYGVIEICNSRLIPREYGVIKMNPKAELMIRLRGIYDGVSEVIQRFDPTCVSVESPFCGKNVQSALTLGHARGVVLLAVGQSNAKLAEFSPAEIKKAVVGNGLAQKSQVEYMVRALLSLPPDPIKDDAFDALAAAICAWNHFSYS